MNIYLAGPMRGIPEFNFPAFFAAAKKLREAGHEVFNPAEADVKSYGKGISNSKTGSERTAARNLGKTPLQLKREVFLKDTTYICKHADAIAMLPGWKKSLGVRAEKALAEALGLPVYKVKDLV